MRDMNSCCKILLLENIHLIRHLRVLTDSLLAIPRLHRENSWPHQPLGALQNFLGWIISEWFTGLPWFPQCN